MGNTADNIKSAANQVAGSVKQTVGKAVGNPSLEMQGTAQKLKGQAQGVVGDAKESIKKIIDKAQLSKDADEDFYWRLIIS